MPWPCNNTDKYIVHFPETREIQSYGSGYGGNALLGKKCFALRIASVMARDDGLARRAHADSEAHEPCWRGALRRRRVPVGVRQDEPRHARSDAAGLEGRDDRRRHLLDEVRRRRPPVRDQPRVRHVRRRARYRSRHEPERGRGAHTEHGVHQHRAHRRRRRVVGRAHRARRPSTASTGAATTGRPRPIRPPPTRTAASPRRSSQVPSVAPEWEDPAGVPISAILFGGRRATTVPLVTEAYNWRHGVFLGSIMGSETTAAAAGAVGNLRRDPFAMLPFCGYNMGDYFAHWLRIGEATDASKLPKLFYVNWFRKDASGKFLWPGYGENSRVLAWVFDRCADATRSSRHADRPPAHDRRAADRRPRRHRRRARRAARRSTTPPGGRSCRSSRSTTPSSAIAFPAETRGPAALARLAFAGDSERPRARRDPTITEPTTVPRTHEHPRLDLRRA